MNKIAYFDCQCGAAGDMILAAMIDAGLDENLLFNQIKSLNLKELQEINVSEVSKNGIRAIKMTPIMKEHHHHHSHDHNGHNHGSSNHSHRHLKNISDKINASNISPKAKKNALSIFTAIAEVEGKIHGKPADEVHFHEVGATDSIVDIVGCCIGFDYFDFDTVYCSTISLGGGSVKCAHGIVPVPAPATAELIKGLPVKDGPVETELLTPTGAAILAHFVDKFKPLPASSIITNGYGSGTKDFEGVSNILRLRIGEAISTDTQDNVWLVESNIDDCTGELIGLACENLLPLALDVWTSPIYMKKNRPAITLNILCSDKQLASIKGVIFNSGLTLGIRKSKVERTMLERKFIDKQTPYGTLKIKEGFYKGNKVFSKPEFESLKQLSQQNDLPVSEIMKQI